MKPRFDVKALPCSAVCCAKTENSFMNCKGPSALLLPREPAHPSLKHPQITPMPQLLPRLRARAVSGRGKDFAEDLDGNKAPRTPPPSSENRSSGWGAALLQRCHGSAKRSRRYLHPTNTPGPPLPNNAHERVWAGNAAL